MGIKPAALLLTTLLAAGGSALAAVTATFSTLITTPLAIEGLTNDDDGNLYTAGRSPGPGLPCPVWKIPLDHPALTIIGLVPAPSTTSQCAPSGLAFGPDGMMYVTQTDRIYRFTPSAATPPTATLFASGVPGTNGLVFDIRGNLWTGDGTTGQGRVWKITPDSTVTEMFRIQPLANEVTPVAGGVANVGRDIRSMGPGTITVTDTSRNASNTAGSQPLVANGLVIDRRGSMFIADTARGALWHVYIESDGGVGATMNCDTTFTPNTLCLDNVWVAHPYLEGADGIVLDVAGNVWVDANERNAVVVVRQDGSVVEFFRNPADAGTKLRNGGPLETPTSPVLVGHTMCTANSDGNRRDNFPNNAGEITGAAGAPKGKISCLDQRINVPGLPVPLR